MGGSIFTWLVIGIIIISAIKSSNKEKGGKAAPAPKPGASRRTDGHGPHRKPASTQPGMPRQHTSNGIPQHGNPDIRGWWDHVLDELTENADRQGTATSEERADISPAPVGQAQVLDTIDPEEGVRTTASSVKPAGTAGFSPIQSVDAADFDIILEDSPKEKASMEIDPEKLIIYSEIMKPRFDM